MDCFVRVIIHGNTSIIPFLHEEMMNIKITPFNLRNRNFFVI
jgi:hypothetical protein